MLLGATGSGKTYLACALGMAAVRNYLTVKYIRLPELLVDFSIARGSGTIRKVMAQYKKYSLLIIDEWLLSPMKDTESRDLVEIIEARYKKASTIFCSQFDVQGWREKLGDPIIADAICDRIVHDSYTIVIDCKDSMRKCKGISENQQRSLRLSGLCPNPRFNALRFSGKSGRLCTNAKKKSIPSAWTHGITLPAKPRIQRSCRSSASH